MKNPKLLIDYIPKQTAIEVVIKLTSYNKYSIIIYLPML